tara:strand:- start:9389 stop:9670 length:282 start_codon:yes stop_codon:yes gene_type:complete
MNEYIQYLEDNKEDIANWMRFSEQYDLDHELCPKCGSLLYTGKIITIPVNYNDLDDFKDDSDRVCSDCKDSHTKHDRVSKIEFRNRTIKKVLN